VIVASQKAKRARKRRNPGAAPRAVPSQRREQRAEKQESTVKLASRVSYGTGLGSSKGYGERPPSPYGGLPVSEVLIAAGLVAMVVWLFFRGTNATLIVGIVVMVLGVLEVTAREHFSGYRSHAALLALIPAIGLGVVLVVVSGESSGHAPLLFVAIPVYAVLFWPLRKRFQIARHARIVRPPAPKD
jgi:hypothetical protein